MTLKNKIKESMIDLAEFVGIVSRIEPPVILPKANHACKNCKYWQSVSNNWGYCKFNAPFTAVERRYKYYPNTGETDRNLTEDILHKEWTRTNNNDWCGQFEQREL